MGHDGTTSIHRSRCAADALLQRYDGILDTWPVEHTALERRTRHGIVHINVAGPEAGRPALLLHAASMASVSWAPNVGPLVAAGCRIYAVADLPALFVHRFDAYARRDDGDWRIDVDIELGGTVGGSYRGQVGLAWSGAGSGSTVLITGGSGKVTATIGPLDGDAITVAMTGVDAANWVYDPRLNQAATSLTVRKPGG